MKRFGNLWPDIIDFDNLLKAARQAQQGKRYRPNVLEFNYNLDQELLRLQAELTEKTYQPGGYRTFRIEDPKPRLISAAPYRDGPPGRSPTIGWCIMLFATLSCHPWNEH